MAVTHILNGTIDEISQERNNLLVTVSYRERYDHRGENKKIRMVVGPRTVVVDRAGVAVTSRQLQKGMGINAIISNTQTRSIPPQAEAFFIEITKEPKEEQPENILRGRIVDVDKENCNFTAISEGNFTNIIRFQVPKDTPVVDQMGKEIGFAKLVPGMRVEIHYENFMTASIPPQTTALEIRVL